MFAIITRRYCSTISKKVTVNFKIIRAHTENLESGKLKAERERERELIKLPDLVPFPGTLILESESTVDQIKHAEKT